MANTPFAPPEPADFTIRPLDKGMFRNLSPSTLPPGGFLTLKNYIATQRGLYRRPGLDRIAVGTQINVLDRPLIDIVPVWATTGTQSAALLTSRYLYQFLMYSAPVVKYWSATAVTGTVAVSGTAVTGTNTEFQSAHADGWLIAGDQLVLDPLGAGAGPETVTVASVTNDTAAVLVTAPVGSFGAGTAVALLRRFQHTEDRSVDWTVIGGATNKIVMADRERPPYTWNGTTFSTLGATLVYCPATVCYFGGSRSDRLWMANIKEVTVNDISSLTYNRQQIRWSSATDVTSFAAADYLYLPYASGAIRKLLNIQHILIVYLGDAVFYGVPSNIADLPYTFSRLGTSGIGLTGPKSIVPYMNAHFFVGQDDIYFLDASMQFDRERNRIGTPVVRETIEQCSDLTKVYACLDTLNSRMLFGFPRDGETIERAWSFDYKAKSWSYDEIDATFLASPQINLGLAWTDLPGILSADTWTGLGTDFATWGALSGVTSQSRVYAGQNGYIFQYSDDGATDNGVAISTEIESGDIDLDLPSTDKTWLRLSVKLEARPSAALAFAVETSMDGGNTWTAQGTLAIAATKREGFLDMTATGSAMRYRLTSASNAQSYTVTEVVWRVIKRGPESEVD